MLDIQGNVLGVIDDRGRQADPIYYAEQRIYGMLGQSLEVNSHDAGDRQILLNALGQPMRTWDSRNQRFSHTYDTLRRPVDRTVSVSGGNEILLGRIMYGDLLSTPADTNHIGRVYRVYDGAGVATTLEFDFKGNPLEEQRQLVLDKTTQPDWSDLLGESTIAAMTAAVSSLLDSETFSASSQRDALNRVLVAISPDDSQVLYTYDEGGALQQVEVKHRGSSTAETVVGDITYNARGQRESVTYGSTGSPTTITTYEYDPQTFRLSRLTTERDSDSTTLQDLYYHYDPVGNVTDIRDEAQQTVYFQNSVVEAANSYIYDAVYRLIEATGREHSTQGTTQRTDVQISVGPQPMTSDPSAMRRYTQKYTYDEVGNILTMQHLPASGSGWTRHYVYDDEGNRLEETSAPGDDPEGPYSHSYTYDAHGNMTAMPHLSSMVWNHLDELQEVEVGSETLYFQYACGQRSRKFVEKTGTTTEERIYLGSFEIYRKRINGNIDIERESLHISDGTGRICIIETKTVDGGSAVGSPTGIWRYQLGNHLGSAAVEVDENGDIISYEEYHPYGTSAYRAVDSSIDVSAKRYRYTGMERDEETSLEYHSARYYAPWLGRWTATDPIGIADGPNRYGYVGGRSAGSLDRAGQKEGRFTGIILEKIRSIKDSDEPETTGGGDGDESIGVEPDGSDDDGGVETSREQRAPRSPANSPTKIPQRAMCIDVSPFPMALQEGPSMSVPREPLLAGDPQQRALRNVVGGEPGSFKQLTGIEGWHPEIPLQMAAPGAPGLAMDALSLVATSDNDLDLAMGASFLLQRAFGGGRYKPQPALRQSGESNLRAISPSANETQRAVGPSGSASLISPAPINIPRSVKPVTQVKDGYYQIKYKWKTGTNVTMEARFHGATPGAPAGSPANWRVTRTFPGNSQGQTKAIEHLILLDDGTYQWVPNSVWQGALSAYHKGTATPQQLTMLRQGHM